VDSSALIFVALAVAWAVYLVPKALKHHDEAVRSRSVEKFSHTMRVLARREPVNRRSARLVVTPAMPRRAPRVETKARTAPSPAPAPREVTRQSAAVAARRRRRVLGAVLGLNLVVLTLAATSVVAWTWTALPAGLLVVWLVACRLSVKAERSARVRTAATCAIEVGLPPDEDATETDLPAVPAQPGPIEPGLDQPVASMAAAEPPVVLSGEIPIVTASVAGGWDMVPTTLPTYVTKPAAARRSVQTIDLESTGVWSSGRSDSDSALARQAEVKQAEENDAAAVAEQRNIG